MIWVNTNIHVWSGLVVEIFFVIESHQGFSDLVAFQFIVNVVVVFSCFVF